MRVSVDGTRTRPGSPLPRASRCPRWPGRITGHARAAQQADALEQEDAADERKRCGEDDALQHVITERETSFELANLRLGGAALYQLSYSRASCDIVRNRVLAEPLRPAEPLRRPSPMTVHASDLALRDLAEHSGPISSTQQPRDVPKLRPLIDVIELQQGDVGLTTVDTRMPSQVRVHDRVVFVALPTRLANSPLDVCRASRN